MITRGQQVATADSYLTQTAFGRLLRWLDDGVDSNGAGYMKMRQRLVAYFERRGRNGADVLVDDTFNRIGHTLETSGAIAIRPPARYCFVVARYVFLEDVRRARRSVSFVDGRGDRQPDFDSTERISIAVHREFRLACLERCLARLRPDQRELAIEYYRGANGQRIERRRQLALRLGISVNALGIRMSRLRCALETCMRDSSREPCSCIETASFPCIHS